MADTTGIQWTDSTWNAWWGCQRVGPGCDHCYAEALDKRTGGAHWGAKADRRRTSQANWNEPLKWQKGADAFEAKAGHRRRVFCGSMMDIMDNAVPLEWSHEAFARIEACDRLDYDLMSPGQNYDQVRDRIKSLGQWYQFQFSLFYLKSEWSLKAVHDAVWAVMDPNDRLCVIEATAAYVSTYPQPDIDAVNFAWFSP